MRYIQYTLDEEEFLRLRTACVKHKTNLKTLTKEAVLYYLSKVEQNKITDGVE